MNGNKINGCEFNQVVDRDVKYNGKARPVGNDCWSGAGEEEEELPREQGFTSRE